jgi:hypothetical protein
VTANEAKRVLLLYRPGVSGDDDPEMVEALELARRDPGLGRWFEGHCAFQSAIRIQLRGLEPPAGLRERILAERKIVRPSFWSSSTVRLAAAALILLFLGLAAFWPGRGAPDRFEHFQARMVGTALRAYRMDILTRDMGELRQFLAARGAPANYEITRGLERLTLTGGGVLRWRDNPVSMVCFDRGDNQMLFLFVMERTAVKDPPAEIPRRARVSEYAAVSWSSGNKAYVLAGPEEPDFDRKYLR